MAFRRKLRFDTHNIKFTSNGIPYLSQFENVSIASSAPSAITRKRAPTISNHSPADGLYIHYPDPPASSDPSSARRYLRRLQRAISDAVTAAGMESPPANDVSNPMDQLPGVTDKLPGQPGTLFRGTYGQVVTALMAAGLSITPCPSTGVAQATKLGALFVARPNGNRVEFTKLTLWG